MRQSESQRSALMRRVRRGVRLFACLGLAPLLAGCFLGTEKPDAALDVPARYRMAPHNQDAALPAVIWWRGFRSKQLTELIEEALTSNLDIAAAVARILQADALARIAGAPLIPAIERLEVDRLDQDQRLVRLLDIVALAVLIYHHHHVQRFQRKRRTHQLQHIAECELRARFLGQEPGGVARCGGCCRGQPVRS